MIEHKCNEQEALNIIIAKAKSQLERGKKVFDHTIGGNTAAMYFELPTGLRMRINANSKPVDVINFAENGLTHGLEKKFLTSTSGFKVGVKGRPVYSGVYVYCSERGNF